MTFQKIHTPLSPIPAQESEHFQQPRRVSPEYPLSAVYPDLQVATLLTSDISLVLPLFVLEGIIQYVLFCVRLLFHV